MLVVKKTTEFAKFKYNGSPLMANIKSSFQWILSEMLTCINHAQKGMGHIAFLSNKRCSVGH